MQATCKKTSIDFNPLSDFSTPKQKNNSCIKALNKNARAKNDTLNQSSKQKSYAQRILTQRLTTNGAGFYPSQRSSFRHYNNQLVDSKVSPSSKVKTHEEPKDQLISNKQVKLALNFTNYYLSAHSQKKGQIKNLDKSVRQQKQGKSVEITHHRKPYSLNTTIYHIMIQKKRKSKVNTIMTPQNLESEAGGQHLNQQITKKLIETKPEPMKHSSRFQPIEKIKIKNYSSPEETTKIINTIKTMREKTKISYRQKSIEQHRSVDKYFTLQIDGISNTDSKKDVAKLPVMHPKKNCLQSYPIPNQAKKTDKSTKNQYKSFASEQILESRIPKSKINPERKKTLRDLKPIQEKSMPIFALSGWEISDHHEEQQFYQG